MNTNIVVTQDRRYKKSDGTYPIILRLSRSQSQQTLPIPTGFSVPLNDWDEDKKQVKKSYKGVTSVMRLNKQIDSQKQYARDILLKLEDRGLLEIMPLKEIKDRIVKTNSSSSFFAYAEHLAKELKELEKFGTARNYDGVVTVLKSFINNRGLSFKSIKRFNMTMENLRLAEKGTSTAPYLRILTDLNAYIKKKDLPDGDIQYFRKLIDKLTTASLIGTVQAFQKAAESFIREKDLLFSDITPDFLKRFSKNHFLKGNTENGLSAYIRAMRAVYNKAIEAGLVEKEYSPFEFYKIEEIPTKKRALPIDLLKEIINKNLEPEHPCFHARNYFVASFMMYGMNFADMAYLKKTDITNGRIDYRRRKTQKLYDIKVTDMLKAILSYYLEQYTGSEYVFPIIKHKEPELIDKDIQWARSRYNEELKQLARLCNIESKLTGYVSRHSFASLADLNQVPVTAISKMLGHSSIKTTEIYLKGLPSNILDDYNSMILTGI